MDLYSENHKIDCPICFETTVSIATLCGNLNHGICISCSKQIMDSTTKLQLNCPICRKYTYSIESLSPENVVYHHHKTLGRFLVYMLPRGQFSTISIIQVAVTHSLKRVYETVISSIIHQCKTDILSNRNNYQLTKQHKNRIFSIIINSELNQNRIFDTDIIIHEI